MAQPPEVGFYHAPGCHLCDRARAAVEHARREVPFRLREVDIEGDPDLESQYRSWLPVIEINGERAFVYHVDATSLVRRLKRLTERSAEAGR